MKVKSDLIDSSRMQADKLANNIMNVTPATFFSKGHILLSTAYLAPVEYYVAIAQAETVLIEQHEYFQKQTYRSRCKIATANGPMDLSIPVDKSTKDFIRDVRISEHSDWQTHHWRSIESAYSSSPFFEYYADDLRPFYEKKCLFLWDFNISILHKLLELLDIQPKICLTNEFEHEANNGLQDFRNLIHPKRTPILQHKPYYQVFEQKFGFIPNLSIIDLLFNMGNESLLVLET